MAEDLKVVTEAVDDIPLLLAQMERMQVQKLLDEHFPCHGNWQGLSIGHVTQVWLAHILSQADHRLYHVQPWADQRLTILRRCTRQDVRALDFSDDRLASVLERLSDDSAWQAFEQSYYRGILRVYSLDVEIVRVDSTTSSVYGETTETGLFQRGHSKRHRPDLPQVKIMMSTLDPMALPLVTDIISGEAADDPLYVPAITKVRQTLDRRGLLYVGDCKMAAQKTRVFVAAGQDFYLCPLPEKQMPEEQLRGYLADFSASGQQPTPIYRTNSEGKTEHIADGFEVEATMTVSLADSEHTWSERHLVIRSLKLADSARTSLQQRVAKAQQALSALNVRGHGKRRYQSLQALRDDAEAILQRYHVPNLFSLVCEETIEETPVRAYGQRPASVREDHVFKLSAQLNATAFDAEQARAGWRVYATNQSSDRLSLTRAVLAYRNEYIIERGFGRLHGYPLSLSPMYLTLDSHATGLIRLLTIALSVLSLLEFLIRERLAEDQTKIAGLYPGNPKRATARPTSEMLLAAFDNISFSAVHLAAQDIQHVPALSVLQQQILTLLCLPKDIYSNLGLNL